MSATINRAIRLPQPPNEYNLQWANNLVNNMENQIKVANLAEDDSKKITQENAEAVSWFYG